MPSVAPTPPYSPNGWPSRADSSRRRRSPPGRQVYPSQVQALERTQPVLPMGLGYLEGITHDYIRHRTTTLFAALDVANGSILTQCKRRHRHQEFLSFLRHIEANVPEDLDVHLICDNYGTHKHAKVRLAGAPAALSSALRSDLQLVAQPGRALVRSHHQPGDPPRLLRLGDRSQAQDQRVCRALQPTPQALHVDRDRRIDPRQT